MRIICSSRCAGPKSASKTVYLACLLIMSEKRGLGSVLILLEEKCEMNPDPISHLRVPNMQRLHTLLCNLSSWGSNMYNNNMYAYRNMNGQMNNNGPQQIVLVEPYVYAALQSLIGKNAVLDTVRGSVGGTVIDVKPDHVVIQDRDSTFFVRLCQIVWIMPDTD
mgnify:CR=1 FL=1